MEKVELALQTLKDAGITVESHRPMGPNPISYVLQIEL